MNALVWSEALALAQPQMDATHREFVDLLAALEDAATEGSRDALPARFADFLAHTEAHFAQEDGWMAALGFAAGNCHAWQHRHVLEVLRAVQPQLHGDDGPRIARELAGELGAWFSVHATSMDAALAQVMAECGFDAASGNLARRIGEAAGQAPATGCGSAACAV